MNDDLRMPVDEPQPLSAGGGAGAMKALGSVIPGAAFTASILLDVMALVADGPEQARSYARTAVDILKFGLGASLAAFALGAVDTIEIPANSDAGRAATKRLAVDGAVTAIYLLDLAARQKQLSHASFAQATHEPGGIGFSLTGLVLLAATGQFGRTSGANVKMP